MSKSQKQSNNHWWLLHNFVNSLLRTVYTKISFTSVIIYLKYKELHYNGAEYVANAYTKILN